MWNWILLRRWMQNLHCLFLDRDNIKEGLKTILTAIDKAKHGISICIFPEGTRNHEADTFLPFHDASFKIAEKSGAPVIPITLVNTASIFEDHLPKIKPSTVVIRYGEPIYLKDLDKETKKNVGAYFQNIISENYFYHCIANSSRAGSCHHHLWILRAKYSEPHTHGHNK